MEKMQGRKARMKNKEEHMARKTDLGKAIVPAKSEGRKAGGFAANLKERKVVPINESDPRSCVSGVTKTEAEILLKEKAWLHCGKCNEIRYVPEGECWKCKTVLTA